MAKCRLPMFGGGENLTQVLDSQNAIITELEQKIEGKAIGGGEDADLAAEVNAQPGYIESIITALKGKAVSTEDLAYVWKKYKYVSKIINLSFTWETSTTIKVKSDDVDLTMVDESFFVGFKGTWYNGNGSFTFENGNVFNYVSGTFTYTYNALTQTITLSGVLSNSSFTFTVNSMEKDVKSFDCYIANINENAYPEKGELNGAYYVKLITGESKLFIQKAEEFIITPTSNTLTLNINHNLGVTPTAFMIVLQTASNSSGQVKSVIYPHHDINSSNSASLQATYIGREGSGSSAYSVSGKATFSLTDKMVTVTIPSGANYFTNGTKYRVIIIA